jgi:hypothetical protein
LTTLCVKRIVAQTAGQLTVEAACVQPMHGKSHINGRRLQKAFSTKPTQNKLTTYRQLNLLKQKKGK